MTHVIHLLRPYHGGGRQEILQQPKIYGFDTGFVRHVKGWGELREEDGGLLWEHVVLDVILNQRSRDPVYFWRTKQKEEIDFVIPKGRNQVHAIECKWNLRAFDPKGFHVFRALHPAGKNIVVAPTISERHLKKTDQMMIEWVPLNGLSQALAD